MLVNFKKVMEKPSGGFEEGRGKTNQKKHQQFPSLTSFFNTIFGKCGTGGLFVGGGGWIPAYA